MEDVIDSNSWEIGLETSFLYREWWTIFFGRAHGRSDSGATFSCWTILRLRDFGRAHDGFHSGGTVSYWAILRLLRGRGLDFLTDAAVALGCQTKLGLAGEDIRSDRAVELNYWTKLGVLDGRKGYGRFDLAWDHWITL